MSKGDELTREVNRLYWETELPVTELSQRLGVSRGTLYNHTHPLPAGVECARCGGTMAYRNRQTRDAQEGHCLECGHEKRLAPVRNTDGAARVRADGGGRAQADRGSGAGRGSTQEGSRRAKETKPTAGGTQPITRSFERVRSAAGNAETRDVAFLFTAVTVGIGAIAAGIMLLGRRS